MTTSILLHVGGSLADFDMIHHEAGKVKHYFSFFRKSFMTASRIWPILKRLQICYNHLAYMQTKLVR